MLGIAAESDRDTIRRAYARKLRQTNPEDDPEGFMKLREAYDTALRYADFRAQGDDPGELEADPNAEAPAASQADHVEPAEQSPEAPSAEQLEIQAHATAIFDALESPEPARWQEASAPLEALLASDAMERLEMRRSVENWLAHQIASHAPQSDVLIDRAIDYFGWEQVGFGHASPAIEAVLRRRSEQALAGQLQHPEHPLHRAWARLQRPKPPNWLLGLQALLPGDRQQMQTLLLHMQAYPGLSFYLDANTVTWWRNYVSRPHLIEAFAFAPILWLLVFVVLTAIRGELVPISSDALIAIPLGLVGAMAYWRATRRPVDSVASPALASYAEWGWMIGLPALPLVAMLLPFQVWTPVLIAIFMAVTLGLQDFAIALRPPSRVQRFTAAAYLTPVLVGLLVSVGITAPFALAWVSVLAGMLVGWHRGQYTLPVRLLGISLTGRRLGFPFVFAALLGLSWGVMRPVGPQHAYQVGLTILLCGPLVRIVRLIEPAGLYRQIMVPLAAAALLIFWVAMSPGDHPVPVEPSAVPLADQPMTFETPTTPPPILWAGEAAPKCPSLAQDRKRRRGAVGPQPCGTMAQWFRDTEYPPEAWNHQKWGLTRVQGTIGVDGRVSGCYVLRGSGSLSLDETTCRLVEKRARFLPARDSHGNPVPSKFIGGVDWRLAKSQPENPTP